MLTKLPKLEWKDGKPFVTDGWIMGSRVIIKEQPSIETIKYVNKLFADQARKIKNKTVVDGKPFVTDGWIMGSRVIIKEQPSIETIKYVNKLFADQARKIKNKTVV